MIFCMAGRLLVCADSRQFCRRYSARRDNAVGNYASSHSLDGRVARDLFELPLPSPPLDGGQGGHSANAVDYIGEQWRWSWPQRRSASVWPSIQDEIFVTVPAVSARNTAAVQTKDLPGAPALSAKEQRQSMSVLPRVTKVTRERISREFDELGPEVCMSKIEETCASTSPDYLTWRLAGLAKRRA